MKKGKYAIGIIIGVLLIVVGVWRVVLRNSGDRETDSHDRDIAYLNHEVSAVILVFGKDIDFRDSFQYERIHSLAESEIAREEDYVYLLMNDLDGNLHLDRSDIEFLKEYADKNTNFNFFYLGLDKLDLFYSGIFPDYGEMEGDMSFGYVVWEGSRLTYSGMWRTEENEYLKSNKDLLGENLLDNIVTIIRTNE